LHERRCATGKPAVARRQASCRSRRPAADYGIATRKDAATGATAFVDYLRGPAGRRVFAAYGFDPP